MGFVIQEWVMMWTFMMTRCCELHEWTSVSEQVWVLWVSYNVNSAWVLSWMMCECCPKLCVSVVNDVSCEWYVLWTVCVVNDVSCERGELWASLCCERVNKWPLWPSVSCERAYVVNDVCEYVSEWGVLWGIYDVNDVCCEGFMMWLVNDVWVCEWTMWECCEWCDLWTMCDECCELCEWTSVMWVSYDVNDVWVCVVNDVYVCERVYDVNKWLVLFANEVCSMWASYDVNELWVLLVNEVCCMWASYDVNELWVLFVNEVCSCEQVMMWMSVVSKLWCEQCISVWWTKCECMLWTCERYEL